MSPTSVVDQSGALGCGLFFLPNSCQTRHIGIDISTGVAINACKVKGYLVLTLIVMGVCGQLQATCSII